MARKTANEMVQVEISLEKLASLFESGVLCAADLHCLTAHSKQHVSDLCLTTCARKIACGVNFQAQPAATHKIRLSMPMARIKENS